MTVWTNSLLFGYTFPLSRRTCKLFFDARQSVFKSCSAGLFLSSRCIAGVVRWRWWPLGWLSLMVMDALWRSRRSYVPLFVFLSHGAEDVDACVRLRASIFTLFLFQFISSYGWGGRARSRWRCLLSMCRNCGATWKVMYSNVKFVIIQFSMVLSNCFQFSSV